LAAGALRLPRGRGGYDEVQRPPLPRWVRLPRTAAGPTPQERAAEIPWHPALRFARRLPRLTEGELWALVRCQRFLSTLDSDEPVLTARERSLRLFGDEKRLDALARGQLFEPGRLSAALLRCRFVHAPFVYRDFGAGEDALILENHDTFHSACAARAAAQEMTTTGTGGLRWLIFGCGNAILKSAPHLLHLPARPARILYFGDLDLRGLQIAYELQAQLRALGLPPILCAAPCYERLCAFPATWAHARARQPQGEAAPTPAQLLSLLPAPVAARADEVLRGGQRWAQEWITTAEWAMLLPRLLP
jgi:hypothetical protein